MHECPNCHATRPGPFDTDLLNQEWYDNSYYDYCIGRCRYCGKTYRWTEVFKFTEVRDIEEVTDS